MDESNITVNSNTYDNFWEEDGLQTTSNSLTVSVDNKELSQKVLDYLISTSPDGQVTPSPMFSKEKEKDLRSQARTKALADAKQKADTTASELGVKVGKVISVDDSQVNAVFPMMYSGRDVSVMSEPSSPSVSLPVLPGKQDIAYTITVTYEIK